MTAEVLEAPDVVTENALAFQEMRRQMYLELAAIGYCVPANTSALSDVNGYPVFESAAVSVDRLSGSEHAAGADGLPEADLSAYERARLADDRLLAAARIDIPLYMPDLDPLPVDTGAAGRKSQDHQTYGSIWMSGYSETPAPVETAEIVSDKVSDAASGNIPDLISSPSSSSRFSLRRMARSIKEKLSRPRNIATIGAVALSGAAMYKFGDAAAHTFMQFKHRENLFDMNVWSRAGIETLETGAAFLGGVAAWAVNNAIGYREKIHPERFNLIARSESDS